MRAHKCAYLYYAGQTGGSFGPGITQTARTRARKGWETFCWEIEVRQGRREGSGTRLGNFAQTMRYSVG